MIRYLRPVQSNSGSVSDTMVVESPGGGGLHEPMLFLFCL